LVQQFNNKCNAQAVYATVTYQVLLTIMAVACPWVLRDR